MKFYKTTKEDVLGLPIGTVIVDSIIHWKTTVVVATPTQKHRFINRLTTNSRMEMVYLDSLEPLTLVELEKLRPHLNKTLIPDYIVSLNDYYLEKLPDYCCYSCAIKMFKEHPKKVVMYNFIGKCKSCGDTQTKIYKTTRFRLSVWDKTKK